MVQGPYSTFLIILIVHWSPEIIHGYTLKVCYIKESDSNSAICQKTPYPLADCDGTDISVTAMTMYIVRHCNSNSQCGAGLGCCPIETNETTPVPDSIEQHLNTCTTVQCLGIRLQDLPRTEYYQVFEIIYSCESQTTQYSVSSTRTHLTSPAPTSQTTEDDEYVESTEGSTTTNPKTNPLNVPTNFTEKNSVQETDCHDSGISTTGYVLIPIVIVLVAVVIGLVWRRRADSSRHNSTGKGISLSHNEYYNMENEGQSPQTSSHQMNITEVTANTTIDQSEERHYQDSEANVATQSADNTTALGVTSINTVNIYTDLAMCSDDMPYTSLHVAQPTYINSP